VHAFWRFRPYRNKYWLVAMLLAVGLQSVFFAIYLQITHQSDQLAFGLGDVSRKEEKGEKKEEK
jgi:hypothetical protein